MIAIDMAKARENPCIVNSEQQRQVAGQ